MTPRSLIVTIVAIVTLGLLASAAAAEPEHEIAPGESLTSIAAADGLSVAQLAAANGLSPTAELTAGVTLRIPPQTDVGTAAAGPATSAPASTTPGGAYRVAVGAGAQPTDETVTPSEVGAVAARNGVSPTLAEAVASEESGFNNDEVSPTGAVGVMQIEPGTWQYLSSELGGPPLSPASAQDNVLGGVELLHSLLEQTGGDQQLAAAAYYQGLGSVRADGMYPGTRRYVREVMALQTRFGGG